MIASRGPVTDGGRVMDASMATCPTFARTAQLARRLRVRLNGHDLQTGGQCQAVYGSATALSVKPSPDDVASSPGFNLGGQKNTANSAAATTAMIQGIVNSPW